jgi:hypothetical protein
MSITNRVLAFALPAVTAAGIVWASHFPLTVNGSAQAIVRLAWGVRPERIETCRELSAEELADVPQHMRQTRVCEGTTAEYRLIVRDGTGLRVDRPIRGGGLRQDRRLYVFEELPVAPGPVTLDVRFERVTRPADHDEGDEAREDSRENAERHGAIPSTLSLVDQVNVEPGDVVLVTYDEARRALVRR